MAGVNTAFFVWLCRIGSKLDGEWPKLKMSEMAGSEDGGNERRCSGFEKAIANVCSYTRQSGRSEEKVMKAP